VRKTVKKFSNKWFDKVFVDGLFDVDEMDDVINFFNSNKFDDSRRYYTYLSSIRVKDGWQDNYISFNDYCGSLDSINTASLYDIKYNAFRYNISLHEAEKIVDEKKKSKATNLEGFIKRHGVEKGTELFEQFQKTSVSCTVNNMSELERKERSKWCKEYYMKRGYDELTSINMAKDWNRNNSGSNRYYWMNQGYSKDEVDEFMSIIDAKKAFGIKQYKEKYGDMWKIKWDDRIDRYRNTIGSICDIESFICYKKECYRISNINIKLYGNLINDIEKRGYEYHLDHIYSVKDGFVNNVDPSIIGHYLNLRIISRIENLSKGSRSDKSLDELKKEIEVNESC